jgi:hypothetical protein
LTNPNVETLSFVSVVQENFWARRKYRYSGNSLSKSKGQKPGAADREALHYVALKECDCI